MHTKKKIVAFLLILLIAAGCGKTGTEKETGDTSSGDTSSGSTQTEQSTLQTSWETPKPEDIIMPSTPEDDMLLILSKDYDVVLVKDMTTFFMVPFEIISSKEIKDDITVKIDNIVTPYTSFTEDASIGRPYDAEFPYFLFQSYQNVDWKLMYSLHKLNGNSINPNSMYEPYFNYRDLYVDTYTNAADEFPKIYHYYVNIAFNTFAVSLTENEEIHKITFTVNGKDHEVDIGKIVLDYETDTSIYSCDGIKPLSLGAWGAGGITPGADGKFTIYTFEFECVDKITIKGFNMLNDGVTADKISIDSKLNDVSMNQIWSGEPMTFGKGTTITIYITVNDPSLIGKISDFKFYYYIMNYEVDGVECYTSHDLGCGIMLNSYEIYAHEFDGIDILSYYYDYYTPTQTR